MKKHCYRLARLGSPAVVLTLLLAALGGCATHARKPATNTSFSFDVGNAVVRAEVLQCDPPRPTMINVHDDENTSVEAGKTIIRESGGRLIELAHGGRRRVAFELDGGQYSFDPNRIFSGAGIARTLGQSGKDASAAQQAVQRFAREFLARFALDREPVIIALHNTGGGGLSINSYLPDGESNLIAAAVQAGQPDRPGNFFYVTDQRFFDYLKPRGYNVILQDNSRVTDDGSLSVYFARKNIPYLNIEAARGHLDEQIKMVRCAVAMVNEIIFRQQ